MIFFSINNHNKKNSLVLHLFAIIIFSLMLTSVFRVWLPSKYNTNESSDYFYYYEPIARHVLSGDGYTRTGLDFPIANPPGFSILLACLFSTAKAFRISENLIQILFTLICMSISTTFVFLLSHKIWGNFVAAWVSAVFFCSYPFVLWLTKQPASEVPFMTVFYASIYFFWLGIKKNKNIWFILVLCGVFAGLAMLIRGIAICTGIILFILFLIFKKNINLKSRLLLALIILFSNILVVFPWSVWAYAKTQQVILLGTNGVNSVRDGLTFAVETKNYRQNITVPADVLSLQTEFSDKTTSMTTFGNIAEIIKLHFQKDPRSVIKLFLIKIARSWYGTDSGKFETEIIMIQILYGIVIIFSCIGIWQIRSDHPELLIFVWSFIIYFWLMATIVLSILRYMVPVIGIISILVPGFFQLFNKKSTLVQLK